MLSARASFTSCITIIGGAIGYSCGFLEIPEGPVWMEHTQFKGLCIIASVSLGLTVAITSTMVLEETKPQISQKFKYRQIYQEVLGTFRILPRKLKTVCIVQFFSWLTWFPFLFSITTRRSTSLKDQCACIFPSLSAFHKYSLRHAILAMLLFQLAAFLTLIGLPSIISKRLLTAPKVRGRALSETRERNIPREDMEQLDNRHAQMEDLTRSSTAGRECFTLARVWRYSHIATLVCMLGATLGNDFIRSVVFVAMLGTSSALTQWAPFAIIGTEIAQDHRPEEADPCPQNIITASSWTGENCTFSPLPCQERDLEQTEGLARTSNDAGLEIRSRTAIFLGLHNIAIALPQILSSVVNSVIYWLFGLLGLGETQAMAWTLRVGCFATVAAAIFAHSLE